MKGWILHLFLFSSLAGYSQNLIRNGSFEQGRCPLRHSIKPKDFQVDHWMIPDGSTPDYYHACAKGNVGVPKNWAGSQHAVDGDGYIGIYLRKGRYQENIGTTLARPLEKGATYRVSFYVANVSNASHLAEEISILITDEPITVNHIKSYDHRQNTFEIPVPDEFMDFSWHQLSFEYVARGGEKYFIMGPLANPIHMGQKNKFRIIDEPMLNHAMYVFLDDIKLEKIGDGVPVEDPPHFVYVKELEPVNILFDFNEYYLKDEAAMALDTLYDFIVRNDLYALVTGGTDSVGTSEYNLELGFNRALSVKDYLLFFGIEEWRIDAKSKGEEAPNYSNHSEEYRRLNRNVLIEFFRKE